MPPPPVHRYGMFRSDSFPFGPPTDPTTMPVRLFGGPAVLEGEEEVRFTPYQSAFLALIWVAGSIGIPRSRVAWLLWESEDDSRARHRISQLLYQISAKTAVGAVIADEDSLKPHDDLSSDLGQLRLRGAARPITGDPLGRLKAPLPTRAFEEWLTTQRTTLRYLAIEKNGEVLARAEDHHDYDLAAEAAKAVLEYDPVNERALRSLIRALALGGSALQAQAAFERQSLIVKRILGDDWKPSRETRRLLGEIDSLKSRQAERPPGGDIQHPVRLIGRSEELNTLKQCCLGDAVPWRDVVILGEPGVGKSRLLEELARQLELEDCRLVRVRSFAAEEGIAFNLLSDIAKAEPFQESVRTLAPLWRKILASALSVEPIDVPDEDLLQVGADSGSRRVYEALRHLFDSVEGRVVILADGFGRADSSSLAALSFLRARVREGLVRFVGTVSYEALQRDEGQVQYLKDVVEQVDHTIELQPLSTDEGAVLLRLASPAPLEAKLDDLLSLTGGNPLYLIELARNPSVRFSPNRSRLAQDLVFRLNSILSPLTWIFLEALSAQSGPVSIDRLAGVTRQTVSETLIALEEARRLHLVRGGEDGVDFCHRIIGTWLYARLGEEERRFLHLQTCRYLRENESPSAFDLAFHFDRAREQEEAYEWALEGGSAAEERGAHPDAMRLFAIAAKNAPSKSEQLAIWLRMGKLYFQRNDPTNAHDILSRVFALEIDVPPLPRTALREGETCFLRSGVETKRILVKDALRRLQRIREEALQDTPPDVPSFLAAADTTLVLSTEAMLHQEARDVLAEISTVDLGRDPPTRCGLALLNAFNFLYGSRSYGISSADAAVATAAQHDLRQHWASAFNRYLIVHMREGDIDLDEVHRYLAILEEQVRGTGDYRALVRALVNLSSWLLSVRQIERGRAVLERADRVSQIESSPARVNLDFNWAEYYLLLEAYEESRARFETLLTTGIEARPDLQHSIWAGYGLSALELGRTAEMTAAANAIPPWDSLEKSLISVDAALLVRFKVRVYEVRGTPIKGLELVRRVRHNLQTSDPISWAELALIEGKLVKKHRLRVEAGFLSEEIDWAEKRNLTELVTAFKQYTD